jgi:membrane-associated protease RseP (regulator of RpoE activity)
LTASWSVFLFYLARALLTRRATLLLVSLLILSGSVGALYGTYDLLRGRGVVVEAIAAGSPFQQVQVKPGDTIWRVGGRRVYSVEDIDRELGRAPLNTPFSVGIISRGEQVERPLTLTQIAAAGIAGSEHNHRFRASGWTRHYETFAELIQMIALLALGSHSHISAITVQTSISNWRS